VLNVVSQRGFGGPRGPVAPPVHDACSPPAGTETAVPARGQRPGGGGGRGGAQGLQPGDYTVRLTVDGKTLTQPVTIKPDPRGDAPDTSNEGEDDRF
jgi:hypothetical protein